MRRLLFLVIIAAWTVSATAQPKARRQQANSGSSAASTVTQRARLQFPTSLEMPDDVVWRRDIYRELDLTQDANAGLYYPVEPMDRDLNLFTYIFKLALNGYIPVYEYRIDGNDRYDEVSKVQMKTILDNYHIYYEERDGKLRVDNSDIPSAEVRKYYLKESAYYDQGNSTFHIKVLSLCPVMLREDDFGGEAAQYPLFWVRYSDLEPFLNRQTVMTSNLNNASEMSLDDYFTLHQYQGKIYKTGNMLGKTLAQYCPDEQSLTREQKRIEEELAAFQSHIFGDQAKKDSLDAAVAEQKPAKTTAKAKAAGRRSSVRPSRSGSSGSGSARVTVRRERH